MVVENRFLSSPPLELFKELLKDILNLTFLVKKKIMSNAYLYCNCRIE
jgi:hypothetical protein